MSSGVYQAPTHSGGIAQPSDGTSYLKIQNQKSSFNTLLVRL